jgi:hypothetical protein
VRGYVNTLEAGRDRIASLGGECDPVDVMEHGDPHLRKAREAITAAESLPVETSRDIRDVPEASGLTLRQLVAGQKALFCCSEDPTFDAVRAVVAAVRGAMEPSCFHTLVMPESTLTVIDPFKAKCRVCYEFFDLPLDGPQSSENGNGDV